MLRYSEILDLFSGKNRYNILNNQYDCVSLKSVANNGIRIDKNVAQNLIFCHKIAIINPSNDIFADRTIESTGIELMLPILCSSSSEYQDIITKFQKYTLFKEDFKKLSLLEIEQRDSEYEEGVQLFWEIKQFMDEVLCMAYEDIRSSSLSKEDLRDLENIQSVSYNRMISELCKGLRRIVVVIDQPGNYITLMGSRAYDCDEQRIGMCYTDYEAAEMAIEEYNTRIMVFRTYEESDNISLYWMLKDEFMKKLEEKKIHSIEIIGNGGEVSLTF